MNNTHTTPGSDLTPDPRLIAMKAFQGAVHELECHYSRETASKLLDLACEWANADRVSDDLTEWQYQRLTRYINAVIDAGTR